MQYSFYSTSIVTICVKIKSNSIEFIFNLLQTRKNTHAHTHKQTHTIGTKTIPTNLQFNWLALENENEINIIVGWKMEIQF